MKIITNTCTRFSSLRTLSIICTWHLADTVHTAQPEGMSLASLPLAFEEMRHLKRLTLMDNPLVNPPSDVCVGGKMQPIGRFLRSHFDREGTCTPCTSYQLISE